MVNIAVRTVVHEVGNKNVDCALCSFEAGNCEWNRVHGIRRLRPFDHGMFADKLHIIGLEQLDDHRV